MSWNGSGTFVINSTGQPVVYNTVIDETVFNALTADLATGLTTCLTKDGQSTPTANITMGGFKLTSVAAATTTGDALSYGRAANVTTLTATGALTYGGVTLTNNVTGTGKMVLDTSPTITSPALVTPALGVATATSINFGGATLSTYAEGAFTPTLTFGGGSTGMTGTFVGQYRKVGKVVWFTLKILLTAKGSSNGTASVGALPFTSSATANVQSAVTVYTDGMAAGVTNPVAFVANNGTTLAPNNFSAGAQAGLSDASFTNTSTLIITGTYSTDS